METSAPIDATKTTAWADLVKTFGEMKKTGINLRQWFNDDPSRVEKLSFTVNDLYFDLSKNLITPEIKTNFLSYLERNRKIIVKEPIRGIIPILKFNLKHLTS